KEYSDKRLPELKAVLGEEDDVLPATYLGRRNDLQKQARELTDRQATQQEELRKQEELIETIRSGLSSAGSPYTLEELEKEKYNLYNIEKVLVTIEEDLERNIEELSAVEATVAHLQELIAKHEGYPGFKFDNLSFFW